MINNVSGIARLSVDERIPRLESESEAIDRSKLVKHKLFKKMCDFLEKNIEELPLEVSENPCFENGIRYGLRMNLISDLELNRLQSIEQKLTEIYLIYKL